MIRGFFIWLVLTCAGARAEVSAETLAATPSLWPREVTVNTALQVPLVINGQASGSMNLPTGRILPVKSVSTESVMLNAGGSLIRVPIADTDILTRAADQQKALAEKPVVVPPPSWLAAPKSTPTTFATPVPAKIQNSLGSQIASDLIAVDGQKVKPFDASKLEQKKYLAVYYSASWCGPCRRFTPEFVRWYRNQKSRIDQFEVIFVSSDRSEADMEQYMLDDRMPWPALSKSARSNPLSQFSGRGIPCLVILDENGQKILDSYDGSTYVGPRKVLEDFEKLLKKNARES